MSAEVAVRATVGAAQIVALCVGYLLAVKQFRMARASAFLERFHAGEMSRARTAVDKWLASGDLSERLRTLYDPANVGLLNEIRMFANFFQELGVAWNRKLVDRGYARNCFDFLVVYYWSGLSGWIADYRQQRDPTLYRRFEELYDVMKKYQH